jgi:hypothetical protein
MTNNVRFDQFKVTTLTQNTIDTWHFLREGRYQVCAALVHGGPEYALIELAAQSIRFHWLVFSGALIEHIARRELLQVACNLQLPLHYSKDLVRLALSVGPDFFSMVEAYT